MYHRVPYTVVRTLELWKVEAFVYYRDESNGIKAKLYLLALDFGFWAPFLLQGLTWAMLYLWTQNYPQILGICPGQLISQNCVLTKIRVELPPPPPPPPPLRCNLN